MNKKIKTVEQAVAEVIDGTPTVQNIEIYVTEEEYKGDEKWETVTTLKHKHEDIAGYQLGQEWLAVMDKQGATFIYRSNQFDFIKHYTV